MLNNKEVLFNDNEDIQWDIPLNTTDINQDLLNIEDRKRTNLFAWKGQFSPQFIEALLDKYATADQTILDPFVGSGTILCEAGRKGYQAIGCELNPAAFILARTYLYINIPLEDRKKHLAHFETILNDSFNRSLDKPLCIWNDKEIKYLLIEIRKELIERYLKILIETLIVMLDFYNSDLNTDKIFCVFNKLRAIIFDLPYSQNELDIFNCDARNIPLSNDSVDLVITSPPYINVFNYHQQYRTSAEYLGWDLLNVAKSEIGSNRKNRGNRFLTVIQYCLDISQVLSELTRVCKPNSRVIFIVGRESNVRGTRFYNGHIVANLATRCVGLNFFNRQERVFKNRFGQLIYEDILHFKRSSNYVDIALLNPIDIAQEFLTSALKEASLDVIPDLNNALETIHKIKSSPIYDLTNIR